MASFDALLLEPAGAKDAALSKGGPKIPLIAYPHGGPHSNMGQVCVYVCVCVFARAYVCVCARARASRCLSCGGPHSNMGPKTQNPKPKTSNPKTLNPKTRWAGALRGLRAAGAVGVQCDALQLPRQHRLRAGYGRLSLR